jgi:hypothetical protein
MGAMRIGIAAACERALVRSARAQRAGSRQQLRAAARRFVRRHRRDAGYLAWVLRSVGASSALALALLGLASQPTHAKATMWSGDAKIPNTFFHLNGGSRGPAPACGDLDADGDLDLVTAASYSGLLFFENTGSATSLILIERTGVSNPLPAASAWDFRAGLGDLDADGDLDLLVGGASNQGALDYYENTGSAASASFVQRTGVQNPVGDLNHGLYPTPALADLDGDGDLDLTIGSSGSLNPEYFENTGTPLQAAFVERTGPAYPFFPDPWGHYANLFPSPAFGDLDRDGDLDLVTGRYVNAYGFRYFENTGSATSPALVERTGLRNPLRAGNFDYYSKPALGDYDADGDLDLWVGYSLPYATVALGGNSAGRFVLRQATVEWPDTLGALDVGIRSKPAAADLDADGDLDLVAGPTTSALHYFENSASAGEPAWVERTGSPNPFHGVPVGGGEQAPALGDLDGDGDFDLVLGRNIGSFGYLRNTGIAVDPAFTQASGDGDNPLFGQDVGSYATPSLGDLDGDGDLDLVAGELSGLFFYFENTGTPASPAFVARTGAANPLDGHDLGYASVPSLGDADGDGDLDLVAGDAAGAFHYFENTGSAAVPAFAPRTGPSNPIGAANAFGFAAPSFTDLDDDGDLDVLTGRSDGKFILYANALVAATVRTSFELAGGANPLSAADAGSFARPARGDLDGDGDLDLVTGEDGGTFRLFENTGSATDPLFAQRSGAANPLDGESVGGRASPALGDLDRDGDLDLVAGSAGGTFAWLENTGTRIAPVFTARTGAENPLDGTDIGDRSSAALADLDADGDLDLVAGEANGAFRFFENTGTAHAAAFAERTGAANPFDGHDAGDDATPSLEDVDGDGDLDLVAGEATGALHYFENTGSATSPAFAPRAGPLNPFDGHDAGDGSAPALADLDADGDPDVVAGTASGELRTFYLPEPGHGALLGAGAALLALLRRLRGRER